MDDFIAHYRPPTMFSLFPDALDVILRYHSLTNETLATLALVNHEANMSQVEETLYGTLPDDWLLTLLQNAPKLHTLCLSGKKTSSPFVQGQTFRKLAKASLVHAGMENLDLSECTDIQEPTLKSLATFFPNLVSLNLSRTSGVTDTAVALIVDRCQYLETINLSYCRQLTDLGLFSVAKFCRRNLRVLNLTGNLKMTNASLLAVAKHCPQIQKLYLAECNQITDSAVEWIARSCSSTSLKELELHRCDRIMFGLPLLGLLAHKCNVLERLTLTYKQINSQRDDLKLVMEAFRDFHGLRTIDIYEVPEHSPALFFWDLAFQACRGKLDTINLYRGSFASDYLLGNYAVAYEQDQNISDQTVRKFNDRRIGAHKAVVNIFVDNIY
ncbi:Dynein regulatory complex subunit 6 [Dissophora ornata]|nr:Dynein regulatory complex subunit 6 [Dissophora ornata]